MSEFDGFSQQSEAEIPPPVIPDPPPKAKSHRKVVPEVAPLSDPPIGPIVARIAVPGLGIFIDLDEKMRDQAIAEGRDVILLGGACTAPPELGPPAPPPKPTRRVHRKKSSEPPVQESVTQPPTSSVVTPSTVAPAVQAQKRVLTSLPMCPQCVRAMTLVERLKASNEGYRTTCTYLIEQHPVGSQARIQAQSLADASATIAQFAVGDAQYVLRNLACARGCLVIPGPPIVQHAAESKAVE
jgi:hypothetical protein